MRKATTARRRGSSAGRLAARCAALSLCVLAAACGPAVVYEESVALPGAWSYADSASFAYEIADASRAYDLELTIRHTDVFPTQNLYARFVTVYPDGRRESQPVSLELADKRGAWLGDCRGGDCARELLIQEAARFPVAGTYGLTLHQFGRRDTLPGVTGLRLRVAEHPTG